MSFNPRTREGANAYGNITTENYEFQSTHP